MKVQASYDIVVVGAGPAGSNAARVAAASGYKTLLIDRRKVVGIPVQCGEYLPTPREMKDMFPNCPRTMKLADAPKDVITNKTTHMSLISPYSKEYKFSLEANVIDRGMFDQHLANQALDSGAELALDSRVVSRRKDNSLRIRSSSNVNEIKAKVVIGADGPRSIIAKSIGQNYTNDTRDVSQSLQYVMEGVDFDPRFPMMFFGHNVAPGGYAWVIQKSESSANIGFGLRRSHMVPGSSLRSYLDHLIRRNPAVSKHVRHARIISRVGASIPVGGPVKRSYSNGVLLAGDAAGHVMASNGGGIPTAMAGGEIAGETAVSHLENGDSLSEYENRWKQEFGIELYSALAILRVADWMMRTDSLTEVAMKLTGSRYLEDVIRCRIPTPLSFGTRLVSKLFEKLY
ncbi:MAG: NAD(P)/FAD-dependent oxidoreductase [Candidatus Thorarchaeota archaeon]|nr:NAD(P)/FAD-dependent oxidoreductase [Candidatus Thorarchaeota archaeon]